MSRLIDADKIIFAEIDEVGGEYKPYLGCSKEHIDNQPTVKAVSIEQLEEMYEKFEKLIWREHEDVRGDDMIEVGYAEQFLQDLLMEFGCWDREESE